MLSGKASCGCNQKVKGFNEYKINGNTTELYITRKNGNKYTAFIDTEDLQMLIDLKYRWYVQEHAGTKWFYVIATTYSNDEQGNRKQKSIRLHHLLLDIVYDDYIVDHIDHNGLNNKRENLRIIENEQNTKSRKGKNSNNKSGYRNVSWNRSGWSVQLQIEGKNTILKRFKRNQLEEAGAYAEKMRNEIYGEFAGLN